MRCLLIVLAGFFGTFVAIGEVAAQNDTRGSSSSARNSASNPSMFGGSTGRSNQASGQRMGMGTTGIGQAMGNNGQLQLGSGGGQTTGSERYMRGNRQAGNFVGSDAAEVSQLFSNLTAGRTNSDGAGNFGPQNRGRGNDFDNAQSNSQATIVPHRLMIGFQYPQPRIALPLPNAAGGTKIHGLSRIASRGPLTVELQDRTLTLRGVVATDHDRALAEQLALLEPGISQVQNELTVAEALPAVAPAFPPVTE
jgi:hypothetical protein